MYFQGVIGGAGIEDKLRGFSFFLFIRIKSTLEPELTDDASVSVDARSVSLSMFVIVWC